MSGPTRTLELSHPIRPDSFEGTDEQWTDRCQRVLVRPSYVCVAALPGDERYVGLVENSFTLGTSFEATQLFWSGQARDNIFGRLHELDGWKNARDRADWFERTYPGGRVLIFDVHDGDLLPVKLDWHLWLLDSAQAAGRPRNKWGSRNIAFEVDMSKSLSALL